MEVLWLEDDSEEGLRIHKDVGGVEVRAVRSCDKALEILESKEKRPQWVIVDLVVPQGRWKEEEFIRVPGLEFMKYVSDNFSQPPGMVGFTYFLTDTRKRRAELAGARTVYQKGEISFKEVLSRLVRGEIDEPAKEGGNA